VKASDIMTSNPEVVTPAESVVQAAAIMRDREIGFVPVVSDRDSMRLLGVITDRDIAVRHVAERHTRDCSVEDHMTADGLATATPDMDLNDVYELMEQQQVRRIPVTDDDGRIVGVIAQADVAVKESHTDDVARVVERISEPARPQR
jgi:CBS domain-containing protein